MAKSEKSKKDVKKLKVKSAPEHKGGLAGAAGRCDLVGASTRCDLVGASTRCDLVGASTRCDLVGSK